MQQTKTMPFPRRPVPSLARVRQHLPTDHLGDPRAETRQRLLDAGLRDKVKRGQRIAITAGSRGMGAFVDLLRGAADAVKAAGGEPFIIPAMGSHGGATPEGQTEILQRPARAGLQPHRRSLTHRALPGQRARQRAVGLHHAALRGRARPGRDLREPADCLRAGRDSQEGLLPLALPSDREAIEVALYASLAGPKVRLCRIKNTDELDQFWASEGLLDEVKQNPKLTVVAPPAPLAFNAAGNLF